MHITVVNAKDHYERGLRGVLASSFQDIVPEEKELLFCTTWLSRNAYKSLAVYAGSGEKGAAHLKKSSQHLTLKNKVFLCLQECKKAFSHIRFE